eukprot:scaffold240096_cov45-Tisochrysis_lutea.AAC.2
MPASALAPATQRVDAASLPFVTLAKNPVRAKVDEPKVAPDEVRPLAQARSPTQSCVPHPGGFHTPTGLRQDSSVPSCIPSQVGRSHRVGAHVARTECAMVELGIGAERRSLSRDGAGAIGIS